MNDNIDYLWMLRSLAYHFIDCNYLANMHCRKVKSINLNYYNINEIENYLVNIELNSFHFENNLLSINIIENNNNIENIIFLKVSFFSINFLFLIVFL